MKRVLVGVTAALLILPSAASAGPSKADRGEAAKECRALLKAAGSRENLGRIFGTNRAKAVRKCRAVQTRDAHNERKRSARQAVEQCKAERAQTDEEFGGDHGGKTFNEFYGQKGDGIGRCVSKQRRANNAQADREDRQRIAAVRDCQDTTSTGREFGRCVANAQSNENAAGGQQHADQGAGNANQGAGQSGGNAGQGSGQGDSRRPDEVPPPRSAR